MRDESDKQVAVIGIVIIVGMLLFGIMIVRQRDTQFDEYATANNCEWSWQGTTYGDDRDYICK